MRHSFVAILCCFHGSPTLGTGRGVAPEEPAAVNLHGGVCEGGARRAAMADLNGHATGNGGHSQGTPTAHRALLYSDIDGNGVYQELAFIRYNTTQMPDSFAIFWLLDAFTRSR